MATATKKSRAAKHRPSRAADVRPPASMEFLIFQDNGGAYHWRTVAGDGATQARSRSFASYDLAEQAAHRARDGAAAARFDARPVEARPVDLIARRHASNDDSDAERWLDDGGSFNSDVVGEVASATLIAPPERSARSEQTGRGAAYRCECGHALQVFGGGRHRVYFELDDSRLDDPVMNRVCPACAQGLPGKNRL